MEWRNTKFFSGGLSRQSHPGRAVHADVAFKGGFDTRYSVDAEFQKK